MFPGSRIKILQKKISVTKLKITIKLNVNFRSTVLKHTVFLQK